LGVYVFVCVQLASVDMVVVDVGSTVVRHECRGVSLDKRNFAFIECFGFIFRAESDDGGDLVQRFGSGVVRGSSVTRGVCGVGGGAKGCFERAVLDVGFVGVCTVRGTSRSDSLFGCDVVLHIGIVVETDGCDVSVCVVVVGLLASSAYGKHFWEGFQSPGA
jgi:hypothetical protein